jgi:uncharacterized protein
MQHERHTALITGASAGIGEAFARVFAENGFDVILTARREDKLISLASEIESRYGVSATVIAADLADPKAPAQLLNEIQERGLDVDALINNAGYGVNATFEEADWKTHLDFMQVLSTSLLHLTHLCLPHMREQKFGWIINVASLAGYLPGMQGGATLYTPVKSFVVKFSQSLWTECRGTGVHVTAVCPGFTISEFHEAMGTKETRDSAPGFMWMTSDVVAKQGFDAVMADKPVIINGWINKGLAVLPRVLPEQLVFGFVDWLAGRAAKKV